MGKSDRAKKNSEELLAKQLVIINDTDAVPEAFEKFVEQRRDLIAARVNEFLGLTESQ